LYCDWKKDLPPVNGNAGDFEHSTFGGIAAAEVVESRAQVVKHRPATTERIEGMMSGLVKVYGVVMW